MNEIHDTSPADPGESPDIKTIKRYTNRKLYDTVESRYVTLDEIAEMVREGEEVRIIDNRTKEDLTTVTLAQIIFEQEKKAGKMPLSVLRNMVRHGGESLQDFIEKEIQPRVATIREGAEQRFPRMFRRERLGGSEGGEPGEPLHEAAPRFASAGEARSYLQDLVEGVRHAVDDWQRRAHVWQREVDDRVQGVRDLPALHRELQALHARLNEIEQKIRPRGDAGPREGQGEE